MQRGPLLPLSDLHRLRNTLFASTKRTHNFIRYFRKIALNYHMDEIQNTFKSHSCGFGTCQALTRWVRTEEQYSPSAPCIRGYRTSCSFEAGLVKDGFVRRPFQEATGAMPGEPFYREAFHLFSRQVCTLTGAW